MWTINLNAGLFSMHIPHYPHIQNSDKERNNGYNTVVALPLFISIDGLLKVSISIQLANDDDEDESRRRGHIGGGGGGVLGGHYGMAADGRWR